MNFLGRAKLLIQLDSQLGKIQNNWNAYQKENPMLTIGQILKSRTVWTLIFAAAFNGWNSISGQVDPHLAGMINAVFTVLALVFRIAPNQHVDQPQTAGGSRGTAAGIALLCALGLASPAKAQIIGPTATDLPQHVVAAGIGIGPTSADYFGYGGFGERVAMTGTYSYTAATFVPHLTPQANGHQAFSVIPTAHTGVRQIVYQQGRFTAVVDGGLGASMPSGASNSWNFSAAAGGDAVWRLNKKLHTEGGTSNNYLSISISRIQLTGTAGGGAFSAGLGFVHSIN